VFRDVNPPFPRSQSYSPGRSGFAAGEQRKPKRPKRLSKPKRCFTGALDRASPNCMGLASLGLDIDNFCDVLYCVLLLKAICGARIFRANPILV
jgi:hypothetical protein